MFLDAAVRCIVTMQRFFMPMPIQHTRRCWHKLLPDRTMNGQRQCAYAYLDVGNNAGSATISMIRNSEFQIGTITFAW